ncbi:MAG: hypothetical protein ACLPN5_03225 [Roseiarcus sp.]
MDLGVTDKVEPLVAAMRAIVRDGVIPIEEEYEAEIGRSGDRFQPTPRVISKAEPKRCSNEGSSK